MAVQVLLVIAGLMLVLFGADWLVDGASAIARRSEISQFVIGLTIVGFGTSCPELVVSLTGALQGSADIAIGNVIGSNIFNTLLILGVTAIISPVAISSGNRKVDIPLMLAVTAILVALGYNGLSRVDGILFLLIFAAYMYFCFKVTPKEESKADDKVKPMGIVTASALSIVGVVALIAGGRLFVDSSVHVARVLGLSDKFIAITLLAGGTSLPELVTCVVAAVKGKEQLALGNIIGSNIFNILLILGSTACITPLSFNSVGIVDAAALLASALLLAASAFVFDRNRISRGEGALFTATFAAYFVWLFINL